MVSTTATFERVRRVREAAGTPATPLQVNVSQVLSQDVVTAATIPVDTSSATPVAVFNNPASGGVPGNTQAEALAVVALENEPVQFAHIAPDSSADGGWTMRTPFGGLAASEVAAGTAYPDSSQSAVFGFLFDGTTLRTSQLQSDGLTWSAPQPVGGSAVSNLHTAYSPAGRLVLYGTDPNGNLATCYQSVPGGSFTTSVCSLPSGLAGDFQLVLSDESSWTLVANIGGAPMLIVGSLGDTEARQSSLPEYNGTLKQVVVGFWSPGVNTAVFVLVDTDDTLYLWSQTPATTVVQSPAGPALATASAAGHVSTDDSLHVYVQDTSLNLWVLHQDPDVPWNDDGTPNWSPPIPLDSGIAGVASSGSPADAPTLFAIDAALGSLRLHVQDPQTQMWRSGPVLTSASQAYEVARYRTEVNVMDANGTPVPDYPVTLVAAAGSSACELSCAGSTVTVGSEPVNLTTDSLGKVTLAMLTTAGLAAPKLSLNAEGLAAPETVQPGSGVLTYLSGQGTLNPTNPGGPLPQFDAGGDTLTAASVDGTQLAPGATGSTAAVAAAAIQNTAKTGLGSTSSDSVGYRVQLSGQEPRFTVLRTQEELAHALGEADGEPESFWSDIERWAGDVWEGIKNGLIKIADTIVDVVNKIATFTVQIGEEIAKGVSLAVAGLEQAAHFISGVFAWVEAEVEKVVDWLKALFDFGAIWRSKMAIEYAMGQIPKLVTTFTDHYQGVADGWFASQEETVKQVFSAAASAADGRQFGDLPGYQQPPPSTTATVAGGATPADFSQSVHNNWFQDKVSTAAPDDSGVDPYQPAQNPWQAFAIQLSDSQGDFVAAMSDLAGALQTLIEHPDTFASQGIADLLGAIEELVETALHLADAMVDAFVGLADVAMDGLSDLLSQELDWGPFNTLWAWMAEAAGYPDDDTLTIGALCALLAAFPTTLLYKLIEGVDTEPFNTGPYAPNGNPTTAGPLDVVVPPSYQKAGGILQAFYFLPAMASDSLGPGTPWYLTLLKVVCVGVIWALLNGLPWVEMVVGGTVTLSALVLVLLLVPLSAIETLLKWIGSNANDIAAVVGTLVGLGELIVAGYQVLENELDDLQTAAGFVLPVPSTFSLLTYSAIRDSAAGPFCTAAKCFLDFAGYTAGGTLEFQQAEGS
ncbi:hypothetical protein [Kitasatospora sp. NPDC047058]|uniref:hypothetical protein n=1 Tax=Kitasatospora sp. NPDC047058 TaxID=3155620 RepID=UPI0033E45E8F